MLGVHSRSKKQKKKKKEEKQGRWWRRHLESFVVLWKWICLFVGVCVCVRVPVVLASPSSLSLFPPLHPPHVYLSRGGGFVLTEAVFCAQATGLLPFWKRSRRHAVESGRG